MLLTYAANLSGIEPTLFRSSTLLTVGCHEMSLFNSQQQVKYLRERPSRAKEQRFLDCMEETSTSMPLSQPILTGNSPGSNNMPCRCTIVNHNLSWCVISTISLRMLWSVCRLHLSSISTDELEEYKSLSRGSIVRNKMGTVQMLLHRTAAAVAICLIFLQVEHWQLAWERLDSNYPIDHPWQTNHNTKIRQHHPQ